MMKNIKREFLNFKYNECDSFADYLHEMSLQGWHFKSFGMGLLFEKGEALDITYAVEVFTKGSEMDSKPEADTEEYAEYCSVAGWQLVDAKKRFCVFKKVSEDAVDIVTPEERFTNIKKAMWRKWCSESLASIFLAIFYLWQFFDRYFCDQVFMDIMLVTMAIFLLNIIWRVGTGICLILWSGRILKQLHWGAQVRYVSEDMVFNDGVETVYMHDDNVLSEVASHRYRKVKSFLKYIVILAVTVILTYLGIKNGMAGIVIVPVLVMLMTAADMLVMILRPSRSNHYLIQHAVAVACVLIFCIYACATIFSGAESYSAMAAEDVARDRVPLLLEDFMNIQDKEGQIVYIDEGCFEGFMGKRLHCCINYGTVSEDAYGNSHENVTEVLLYDVYYTKYDWVQDRIWEMEVIDKAAGIQDCTETWQANAAVCDNLMKYYVRYPQGILILYSGEMLDVDQIQMIREKLGF